MTYSVRPVTVSASIPAAPDEVFAYISDTRNDPEWNKNVSEVRQVSGDGVEVGSVFEFTQRVPVGKKVLESDVSVRVAEIGERFIIWEVEDKFQGRRIAMTVEPEGDGSQVTQITEASFKRKPGANRFLYPLLAKRTFRSQFEALKEHFGGV